MPKHAATEKMTKKKRKREDEKPEWKAVPIPEKNYAQPAGLVQDLPEDPAAPRRKEEKKTKKTKKKTSPPQIESRPESKKKKKRKKRRRRGAAKIIVVET